MRASVPTTPAFALVFLALSGLVAGWSGCSSGGSSASGTGSGGSAATSGPGSGAATTSSTGATSGTGGSEKDGGKDSGGKSTSSSSSGTGTGGSSSSSSSSGTGTGGSISSGTGTGGSTTSSTSGTGTGGSTTSSTSGTGTGGSTTSSSAGTGGSNGCETATTKACDGKCVAIDDPSYGCTPTGCAPCTAYPNAMQTCLSGACALGNCNTGFKNCDGNDANGCEVNINGDPANCGACGAVCTIPHATPSCAGGTCGIGTCDSGWTDCNNDPTDGCEASLQNDPMNCGACGTMCQGQEQCQAGQCVLMCATGTANCPSDPPDVCATKLGTNTNCNFCGDTCNLANATSNCDPNSAAPPAPPFVCDLEACNPGFANCDQVAVNGCETNTNTDANNCGSCGNVCPSGPHSTALCNSGACGIVCDPGYLDCNNNPADGCEVNGNGDAMNCGGCGTACSTPNATPACTSGQCSILACNSGFADCDRQVANGCEVNLTQDPKNCGTCGTLCTEANGTAVCTSGLCALGPCNAGFANCDGKYTTGCNVNTNTDTNNCGGCNDVCNLPNATPTCTAGVCRITSCNPPFADCDGNPANGCETNLGTSTSNCGGCGILCSIPHATPTCSNGGCAIAACQAGFANCDFNPANGCETNFLSDPNNCGGCGMKCSLPNATAACTNGTCAVAVCAPGFADCDGNPANGCEVNVGTDTNNCGGCGAVCKLPNATAGCTGGACTVTSCNAGFADCDHVATNGCEVNANTDASNCGSCGHQCSTPNGTPGCGAGLCTVASCNTGFANCDGSVANGCETNTTNDTNNCGSCGNACVAACGGSADHVTGGQCVSSTCSVTACAVGYEDFDGTCSNGCECVTSTTQNACAAAQILFAGTLPIGTSTTPFSATMAPVATVTQAWFTVTFSPDTGSKGPPPGTGFNTSYAPTISLTGPTVAGVPEFVFDVDSNCGGTLEANGCTDNGANGSKQVVGWGDGWSSPMQPTQTAVPTPGTNGQVWIKVYRNPAMPANEYSCGQYTIKASN